MIDIFIDVETRSSEDLIESGVYRYCESPDFSILWLSFQVNDRAIRRMDITIMSEENKALLADVFMRPDVRLHAHNAQFERICINTFFGINVPIERWYCTMAQALRCGLPGGLDQCAQALGIIGGKLPGGKTLINFFSKPRKPTKDDSRRWHVPAEHPEKWQQFGNYNVRDVELERMIYDRLQWFEPPDTERQMFVLDQRINDTGVLADTEMCHTAMYMYSEHEAAIIAQLKQLTNLDNPNSLPQIKEWIADYEPHLKGSALNKDSMEGVLRRIKTPLVKQVLSLRAQLSSVSIQKYERILVSHCADRRLRGTIQYCGAGRTWRFAGRGVQPHNLVKTEIENVELARGLLKDGDSVMLKALWQEGLPYCLSQLIRTALIPTPEHVFCISDFSAIEAVVISWLAGEQWRLDVFKGDGKIYETSASKMFGVPVESIDKKSPYRARGKVSELALGFQGSVGALICMGALKMGIKEEELTGLVRGWRGANKRIVAYWYAIESAFRACLREGKAKEGKITMEYKNKRLSIMLPSGRPLIYQQPKLASDGSLSYMGTNPITKQWTKIDTYGGKLVENIVQATARDLLVAALLRIDEAGYKTVLHVHDEIVAELPEHTAAAEMKKFDNIMKQLPPWAEDLPLKAVTTLSPFYRKD